MLTGVKAIVGGAFWRCDNLKEITIPSSVTSIGNFAFSDCESLKSITIPNSVTSIEDGAFYCCTSLEQITIPESIESIGYYAFENCESLSEITFMHTTGTVEIGEIAFYNIKSGAVATFANSSTKWTSEGTTYTGSTTLTNLHATTPGENKTWTITKNS